MYGKLIGGAMLGGGLMAGYNALEGESGGVGTAAVAGAALLGGRGLIKSLGGFGAAAKAAKTGAANQVGKIPGGVKSGINSGFTKVSGMGAVPAFKKLAGTKFYQGLDSATRRSVRQGIGGAFNGAIGGAVAGAVAGGFSSNESMLSGAFKGAMVGAAGYGAFRGFRAPMTKAYNKVNATHSGTAANAKGAMFGPSSKPKVRVGRNTLSSNFQTPYDPFSGAKITSRPGLTSSNLRSSSTNPNKFIGDTTRRKYTTKNGKKGTLMNGGAYTGKTYIDGEYGKGILNAGIL